MWRSATYNRLRFTIGESLFRRLRFFHSAVCARARAPMYAAIAKHRCQITLHAYRPKIMKFSWRHASVSRETVSARVIKIILSRQTRCIFTRFETFLILTFLIKKCNVLMQRLEIYCWLSCFFLSLFFFLSKRHSKIYFDFHQEWKIIFNVATWHTLRFAEK